MPKQPELFERSLLSINPPPGVDQPALWVRRLTIWKEPGVPVRTIELRPGLNFIWSPDPADSNGSGDAGELGHGAGKTLFCRLLRYCLGEDRFAPNDQHLSISAMFLHGWVSAEVMLMGTPWGVLRPLGVGRGHFAVEGVLPAQLFDRLNEPTGMTPLLNAIENKVLTAKVASLIPVAHPNDAWRVTLAWLTRDQECRFDHVLDWRAVESDSESPTRSMSRGRLQDALRVLIKAISPEEMNLQNEIALQTETHKTKVQDIERQQRDFDKLRREIIHAVNLKLVDIPDGSLCIDVLRQAARRQLAQAAKVSPSVDVSNLEELRERLRDAGQRVVEMEKQQAVLEARLPLHELLRKQYQSELPIISMRARDAEVPTCQICEVPIDLVLAQGCKLSHKLPDADALRQRQNTLKEKVSEVQAAIAEVEREIGATKHQLPPAFKERDTLRQILSKAEKLNTTRSSTWFNATKNLGDINRLAGEWDDLEKAQLNTATLVTQIEEKRDRMGAFREQQSDIFSRLSTYFDAVIRTAVGSTASGRVVLDGNGLKLTVQLGGERSTAAIESLKVIAFDIAVMCMSMEGLTHVPAFLVHDSPREADLGLSVYHQFFNMVAALEGQDKSVFQYIVTTTTQPPMEFQKSPWMRAELRGSPAIERLLRCDLP